MNFSLIGPRGVGKSKVSRKLSKLIAKPFVSTDMISVYETGISIPEQIKKAHGKWTDFRELEYQILLKLSSSKNLIIDCGGGILFDVDQNGNEFYSEKKVSLLKSFSKVFFLSADTDFLVQKVINDQERPELSKINSYRDILIRRLPFYKQASDFTLEIDNVEPKDVAKEISNLI